MYITNELISKLINNDTEHRFYVYSLHNPSNDKIFYIGKGCKSRYRYHWFNSSLTTRTLKNSMIKSINKTGHKHKVKIIAKDLYEHEAFIVESKLISLYGTIQNNTGPLTNMTSGGEGSAAFGTYERTLQHKALMSRIKKGTMTGLHNPMYGKKRPDAALRMTNYHKNNKKVGVKSPRCITFFIYDSCHVIRYVTTSFEYDSFCIENNLPRNALYESYNKYNSYPIYCKGNIPKKFSLYKGWYMSTKKKKD